jgi:hypothetical protein
VDDFKFDLTALTNYKDQQGCIEATIRNINDTNNFLKETDKQMQIQREAIFPVLKMIHIVAEAPKFVQSAT